MLRPACTAIILATAVACTPWPWLRTAPSAPAYGLRTQDPEEARRLREDPAADRHLRAAAWLHGALAYLPPAVTTPSPEARTWLIRASELEPREGGAGAVARTLLALLTGWETEHEAQQSATRAAAKAKAAQTRLTDKVRALGQEMERLKAIDLAPLPAEKTRE